MHMLVRSRAAYQRGNRLLGSFPRHTLCFYPSEVYVSAIGEQKGTDPLALRGHTLSMSLLVVALRDDNCTQDVLSGSKRCSINRSFPGIRALPIGLVFERAFRLIVQASSGLSASRVKKKRRIPS